MKRIASKGERVLKSTQTLLTLCALTVCACAGPPPAKGCEETCTELVGECSYAAFPSHQSCVEGCLVDAEVGAPVSTLQDCVSDSACDPFRLLECSRAFGGEP